MNFLFHQEYVEKNNTGLTENGIHYSFNFSLWSETILFKISVMYSEYSSVSHHFSQFTEKSIIWLQVDWSNPANCSSDPPKFLTLFSIIKMSYYKKFLKNEAMKADKTQ